MITIFSIPKPFKGHIKVIQTNAIRSWLKLRPPCQVILFGDDEGIAEMAEKFGVQHVSEIKRNEFGTPLLDHVFRKAHELAEHDTLCYVNGDIILMSDFIEAIEIVSQKKRQFLAIGRRWNIDIEGLLDFDQTYWEERLRKRAVEHERSIPYRIWMYAMDYFAFPRGLFNDIPQFAVGRAGWDNWMVYCARFHRIPTIDIGNFATVVHQNHDYTHLSMGQTEMYRGMEAESNIRMAGGRNQLFNLLDATHFLECSELRTVLSSLLAPSDLRIVRVRPYYMIRFLETFSVLFLPVYHYYFGRLFEILAKPIKTKYGSMQVHRKSHNSQNQGPAA